VLLVVEEAHNTVSLSDQKNQRFALVMMPWHFLGRGMETRGFAAVIIHCWIFLVLANSASHGENRPGFGWTWCLVCRAEQTNKINFPRR